MYEIDFTGTVKDAQDTEFNIALILALVLQHATSGDAMKMNAWATRLVVDGKLIMDKSDMGMLKGFVETCPAINLIKATVYDRIENSKEVQK